MKLQNNEYKSDSGHRIIVVRENDRQVLLCQITPRTEAAEQLLMEKGELIEKLASGKWEFVRHGNYNCDTSPLPVTIKKEKPKDSGKPIHLITQITLI